jgi:SAM-dependent methyltransferase
MEQVEIPRHLKLYDEKYFSGNNAVSGYDEYANCVGVMRDWSSMLENVVQPKSVLDIGAAYGFVVQYFTDRGLRATGVEPSAYARSRVDPAISAKILEGSLPHLPMGLAAHDVVTCTEVMEHLPEGLVSESIMEMASLAERYLVCLVMLEGPGADGDEGHICLKSRSWWENQFNSFAVGMTQNKELEDQLNNDPYSVVMYWSTRFFVWERK